MLAPALRKRSLPAGKHGRGRRHGGPSSRRGGEGAVDAQDILSGVWPAWVTEATLRVAARPGRGGEHASPTGDDARRRTAGPSLQEGVRGIPLCGGRGTPNRGATRSACFQLGVAPRVRGDGHAVGGLGRSGYELQSLAGVLNSTRRC